MKLLTNIQIERLKANWGEKADSMACYAEVRVYDPQSNWACYIYALNPDDEDEIACIITGFTVEVCDWKMSELYKTYNELGLPPEVDKEYRPIRASELFKELNEGLYDK